MRNLFSKFIDSGFSDFFYISNNLLDGAGESIATDVSGERNDVLNTIARAVVDGDFEIFIELFSVFTDGADGSGSRAICRNDFEDAVFAPSKLTGFVDFANDFKLGAADGEVALDGAGIDKISVAERLTTGKSRVPHHIGSKLTIAEIGAKFITIREFSAVISPTIVLDGTIINRTSWRGRLDVGNFVQ